MKTTPPSLLLAALVLLLCVSIAAYRQQINTPPEMTPVPTAVLPTAEALQSLAPRWIVSADEARSLIAQGATALDARGGLYFGHIKGAISVSWKDFSPTDSAHRGNLLASDTELSERLQDLGVSTDRPVVVFGNPPRGWGEDGRIVWMLRSLGHTQATMVDGGFRALTESNISLPLPLATSDSRFKIQRNNQWSIEKESLKRQLGEGNLIVVDTREAREFSGSTPYGEQRGGHIIGAVHLYFKDLLDSDGRLLPEPVILDKLDALNITPDKRVVAYCTGGIRSSWLVAVLTAIGFRAQNYAGSMWEWSASPAYEYPLEMTSVNGFARLLRML